MATLDNFSAHDGRIVEFVTVKMYHLLLLTTFTKFGDPQRLGLSEHFISFP